MYRLFIVAPLLVGTLLAAGAARAVETESPRTWDAGTVLGAAASGPGYRVAPLVRSDGFMRRYELITPHGRFVATGAEMFNTRINEIAALQVLERLSTTREFADAAGAAAIAPIRFVGRLATRPADTIDRAAAGVGRMVRSLSSSTHHRDGLGDRLIGVDRARREIAYRFAVDPYTDFAPLAAKLEGVARASAIGGFSVKAMFGFVPGGIGLAVSGLNTADTAQTILRDRSPDELAELNFGRLRRMGVPAPLCRRFLANRTYTPGDQTSIVLDLQRLDGVSGREHFVRRIAGAATRSLAFFHRRRIRLIAEYHRKYQPLAAFVMAAGVPLNRRRDGTVLALFPMDQLSWTPVTARALIAVSDDLARQMQPDRRREFAISGTVTAMAARELAARGWMVTTDTPPLGMVANGR